MSYFDITGVSNSSLSTFNYDVSLYYKQHVTKELKQKEASDSMILGSLIHCLLLEPHKFEEEYVVSKIEEKDYPTGMMVDFIHALTQHEIHDEIAYQAAYQASGYKISLDKVKENFEKPANKAYYEALMSSQKKTLIKESDYDLAIKAVALAENNPQWKTLLPNVDEWTVYAELEHYWEEEVDGEIIQLKSKLDQVWVKAIGDTLHVKYIDYKTDSKNPVHKYVDTFEYYKTYRQLYFYKKALTNWVKTIYPDYSNFHFTFHICVIDVVRIKTLIYNIDKSYLLKGQEEIERDLLALIWHHKTNNWDYPKSIYDSLELSGGVNLVDKDHYLQL
jgi:hypothetical protein